MNRKTLITATVAAAFASSLAYAEDKKAAGGASSNPGAEAMFKQMDKNNDGTVSKEEAKGTPHEKDFAKLDKNGDGKLSREEHAAAPEHSGAAAGGASGKQASPAAPSGGTTPSKKY